MASLACGASILNRMLSVLSFHPDSETPIKIFCLRKVSKMIAVLAGVFLSIASYLLHFGSFLVNVLSSSVASRRAWYQRSLWKASAKILVAGVCLVQLAMMIGNPLYSPVTLLFAISAIGCIFGTGKKVLPVLMAISAFVSLEASPSNCAPLRDEKSNKLIFILIMWVTCALCWKSVRQPAILCGTSLSITFICLSVTGPMITQYKECFNLPEFCLYWAQSVGAAFAFSWAFRNLFGCNISKSIVWIIVSSVFWDLAWMVFISRAFNESGHLGICFASVCFAIILAYKILRNIGSARTYVPHEEEMMMRDVPEFERVYEDEDDGFA